MTLAEYRVLRVTRDEKDFQVRAAAVHTAREPHISYQQIDADVSFQNLGWTEEASLQAVSLGEGVFCPAGQGGGPKDRSSVPTGAAASRARGSQKGGGQAEGARTQAKGRRQGKRRWTARRRSTRKRVAALRSEIEALEKKVQAEETNWD